MSDKKISSKQTDSKQPHQQRYKPWLRKPGRGGGQTEQVKKNKDPEEVPILTFGPNNNFAKFKEALSSNTR
jgi:hypothetical protein